MSQIEVIAPATVANLNVGFDALGLALTSPVEKMILRTTVEKGVKLILEPGSDLPSNPEKNVAGKAAISALEKLGNPFGVEIEIYKSIMPGSGIGSSAASAAAAVVGVSELGKAEGCSIVLTKPELLYAALDGEEIASGSRHADNIAPALFGGICLITPEGNYSSLPVPENLHLVVLHPQVEIKTSEAREVLPDTVSLSLAIEAMGWMGRFVQTCYENDIEGFAHSLKDVLVGPHRQPLLPSFVECEKAAYAEGALGGGVSGSGPSSFWVMNSEEIALKVAEALGNVMKGVGVEYNVHVTRVSNQGAHAV
ncbi:MAG TPA: homoserine kinase [Flavobacteriales bacterium]|nr:homoserine kinase [Flavobacteriales bacterium]HHZ94839.1 homoserine kinase [Flavobacteriales bacterium]HIB78417.1 homoserine kinase [Flavobacteriales bacterium]HIN41992.1 homoserine kinase [Flavobacteriales bacterium]HIO16614.1 homoserine kinase [Flavobacteriales bacterium]